MTNTASSRSSRLFTIPRSRLFARRVGIRIDLHTVVDSTNSTAFEAEADGAPDGTVIVADAQRVGRGRLGRRWNSPARKNLYLSILLTRGLTRTIVMALPFLAAIAVREAILETTGCSVVIKWPNDLIVNRRKVGGVLVETRMTGSTPVVAVIGIGINVNWSRRVMPAPLRLMATSLQSETGRRVSRPRLLVALLNRIDQRLDALERGGAESLVDEWGRHCVTLGQRVAVDTSAGLFTGVAETVDPAGRLIVRHDDGSTNCVTMESTLHLEDQPSRHSTTETPHALRH